MLGLVARFRVYMPTCRGISRIDCDLIAAHPLMLSVQQQQQLSLIGGHERDARACGPVLFLFFVFACWLMEAEKMYGVFCRLLKAGCSTSIGRTFSSHHPPAGCSKRKRCFAAGCCKLAVYQKRGRAFSNHTPAKKRRGECFTHLGQIKSPFHDLQ